MTSSINVRTPGAPTPAELAQLAAVLHDCVQGGASVSFMLPFAPDQALAYWQDVARGVAHGERALLVAEDEQGICGTVQLVLAQPPNQPHRADVSKLLVHRRVRNRGIGELLMRAVEDAARGHGKTLLVLDTASDSAERLYTRLGWVRLGVIPGYALRPQGGLCDTVYFYRQLS